MNRKKPSLARLAATETSRRYRKLHPERVRETKRRYREHHQAAERNAQQEWYARRGWYMFAASRRRKKLAALKMLGGQCAVCGETDDMRLTFDHVNGDGREGRKNNGEAGEWLHARLLSGKVDARRFRVLCYNCNLPLAHFGFLAVEAMQLLYERPEVT